MYTPQVRTYYSGHLSNFFLTVKLPEVFQGPLLNMKLVSKNVKRRERRREEKRKAKATL